MRFLTLLLSLAQLISVGQSLASLNLNYWYDPNNEIDFIITPINTTNGTLVYYKLISNRIENSVDTYSIAWENRASLGDRNGKVISPKDSILVKAKNSLSSVLSLPPSASQWFITAKITNTATQSVFYFYKPIDPLWPINTIVSVDNIIESQNYIPIGSSISLGINNNKKTFCFLYKTNFSAALPPFSEPTSSDPFLIADSVFEIGNSLKPNSVGLYLFQEDTTSAKGFSFLVTPTSFPKYNSLASLADPLVYICTDDEYQQLKAAKRDKAQFDRVILDITRDKERAKNLMRSYFQRVETANRYFSDYKEGWKTDRGMIYIIYGLPDEVSRTPSNEIWFYRDYKAKFVFNKSGSVFSPESYKLQRDSQYMPRWFALVDLWRKSRF